MGGTHTDIIAFDTDSGEVAVHKVPSTPHDHSVGLVDGVSAVAGGGELDFLAHGTTIATNALLQHDGATTGLITTAGFRDILHIARHQRPLHYSIRQQIPWQDGALIPRRHRKVVHERVDALGQVTTPLDEEAVRQAAEELAAAGVESVVIAFLNSYRNATHELRAAELVREVFPAAFITTSAGVSPQFREYERFTAAAVNGFVGPTVQRYIGKLGDRLASAGLDAELRIMRSNGGAATPRFAADYPVTLLMSGPAAGVLAGAHVGNACGRENLVTFDVGGTSADIGIVTSRSILESSPRDTWIAGLPIVVPMIDVHTVGAGGGSVAYVDSGGAFRVGPRSAGASPGPACYGQGGEEPTVTDANLVLGRLRADRTLAGSTSLRPDLATEALRRLGEPLGMTPEETAAGVLRIVNNNMANAIRTRTIQKGKDPRAFTLVAFGGAGPLHAAEVAASLGLPEVLVPRYPGITSAMGLLASDLKYDLLRTMFLLDENVTAAALDDVFSTLGTEAREHLVADGVPAQDMSFERYADCRYLGQGYELRVPLDDGVLDEEAVSRCWKRFHQLHAEEYGHAFHDSPIELINVRVIARGELPKLPAFSVDADPDASKAVVATDTALFRFGDELKPVETTYYERSELGAGAVIEGPAVAVQMDSTTVIPPGTQARVLETGDILIRIGGKR
ncbi:methylhydantoinase [Amycolatopsis acidiphila]|nr:methylhydantoinase [Amycolatopsis acidiphila]